jgi:hypothetical protein
MPMPTLTDRATSVDWADRAATAEYLTGLVTDLVCRVRDDDPDITAAWIARRVPPEHMPAFAIVLAAHIPTDRSQTQLIAWALPPDDPMLWREGHRKFVALRTKGVPVAAIDPEIAHAERAYHAARHAARGNDRRRPSRLSVPEAFTPASAP